MWEHGPFQSVSHTDLIIFSSRMKPSLGEGEVVITYNGYHDSNALTSYSERVSEVNFHKRISALHETVSSRLKSIAVLRYQFGHHSAVHYSVFFLCLTFLTY